MGKKDCRIRIGTSGWHYDHWIGRFYPEDMKKKDWLDHFAKTFDTVEVNNTFYHLPRSSSVEQWYNHSPKDFLFTVKASRYITHIKRLSDPKETLEPFFERVNHFKEKLGPVLYQLPPNFRKNTPRLETFLAAVPKDTISVFEFRHDSWYDDEIYDLLQKHNAVFCIHDNSAAPSPSVVTSGNIYIRLHSSVIGKTASYTNKEMRQWADWIKANTANASTLYVYFNNDVEGYAIKNAKTLMDMLGS